MGTGHANTQVQARQTGQRVLMVESIGGTPPVVS
jgi:hypothetical protein